MNAVMQMVGLVLISWLVKAIFLFYRTLPYILPLAGLFYLFHWCLFQGQSNEPVWWATGITALATAKATKPKIHKDNPYRAYIGGKGWLEKRVDGLIAWIGTIKYFNSPLCVVEGATSYRITGDQVRQLISNVLKPGDIILRGYDGYLDGVMIKMTGSKAGPGTEYSHAAVYLGDVNDSTDRAIAARRLQVLDQKGKWTAASPQEMEAVRNDNQYFSPGPQRVLHSMTRGVFMEDILTFLRCDYIAVIRLPENFRLSPQELAGQKDHSLIADLPADAQSIRQKLLRGETVTSKEVLGAVRLSALGKVGSCYDFQFNDAKTHQRFSCSEFAYYCFKSIHCYIGLELKDHGMGAFLVRKTITPSDIFEAAVAHGKLQIVWPKA